MTATAVMSFMSCGPAERAADRGITRGLTTPTSWTAFLGIANLSPETEQSCR